MPIVQRLRAITLLVILGTALGCSDQIPEGVIESSESLTTVRYDPTTPLLNDVPWPNDGLCWTKLSHNEPCLPNIAVASLAPVYADWISSINDTLGWSTTGIISLPIQRATDAYSGPALDLSRLLAAQQDTDFANDALYVIDLSTGLPVSLDFENHLTSFVLQEKVALDPTDPHQTAPSLSLETQDERFDATSHNFDPTRTSDGTTAGTPVYRPEWDRDSDGLLDVPVYERGQHCAGGVGDTPTADAAYARCLADNLVPFYDPAQDRLRIRPRAPLREHTTYAVVVTSRLLDNRQRPIGSPFATAYHPIQKNAAERVESVLSKLDLSAYYGSLSGTGLREVRFVFTFTTAAPVAELRKLAASYTNAKNEPSIAFLDQVDLDATCGKTSLRDTLVAQLSESLRFTPGEREALRDDLANVASFRTGQFTHPSYLTHQAGTLRVQPTPGTETETETVTVPILLTVPRNVTTGEPIPVTLVSHDAQTNRLDGLRSAGQWARFGLGALLFDRIGAMTPLSTQALETLRHAAKTNCTQGLSRALLAERSDATLSVPSPLSYDVVSTRDQWRSGAIELGALAHSVSKTASETGGANHAPQLRILGYLGQGEGAAISSLAATLPDSPKTLVAIDPTTSPARAWARGTTWGAPSASRLMLFGPRVAGVPTALLNAAKTSCRASESSLRLLSSAQDYPGAELGCLSLLDDNSARFPSGATVTVTNVRTLERRCVGMTSVGEFSLGIPAEQGDRLELLVYEGMNVVRRFGRNGDCAANPKRNTLAFELTTSANDQAAPTIASGLGLERQSAEFRTALDWAEAAFGPANPNAYFAELGRATPGSNATGTLILLSPGDPLVAPDEGLSVAVASGLVPNLPADSLMTHPEFAVDTTPSLLSTSLRQPTAELAIAMGHLAEGAPWLMRHDPEPLLCGVNHVDASTLLAICQSSCETADDCPDETACVEHTCIPSSERCAQSLYDADRLSGDLTGTNTEGSVYPLRLGRYAGMPTSKNLATLWQPRTIVKGDVGAPSPLHPNWPFVALALPLNHPRGSHGIPTDDLCQRFRFGTYVPHLLARFLLTQGRDVPPILGWAEQSCLSDPNALTTCHFLASP